MQSAGTLEPVSRRMMSPTTRSHALEVNVDPSLPLMAVQLSSRISPYNAMNCLSF